jgi:hypothetical protein
MHDPLLRRGSKLNDGSLPDMTNELYYETIDKMEKAHVSREYVVGWASGFLQNPKREEQRLNEAYEAGYEDGEAKNTDNYEKWVEK